MEGSAFVSLLSSGWFGGESTDHSKYLLPLRSRSLTRSPPLLLLHHLRPRLSDSGSRNRLDRVPISGSDDFDGELWDSGDGSYGGSVFCFHRYAGNSKQALFGIFDGHRGAIATELADLSKYIIDEVVRRDQHETETVT
ncbi:hypothetical protein NL676_019077 [Syzygium grande]|nr:hypothetical protein NL676_019077 [Syzygium grande]